MSELLPLKGGWVMITRRLPTRVQVPVFSIFYAVPEKVFPAGWHSDPFSVLHPSTELELFYRWKQNGKLKSEQLDQLEEWLARQRRRVDDKEWEPEIDLRVRIATPDGEVCVEPFEYSVISDVDVWLSMIGEDVEMHQLGGMEKATKLQEQMFYCAQRGIPKVDAFKMLLGTINRPNVFWLQIAPQYAELFGRA